VLSNLSVFGGGNRKEGYGELDLSFIQRKTSINKDLRIYAAIHNSEPPKIKIQ